MEKLLIDNKIYNYYEYPLEKEFEQIIVEKSVQIFGQNSIYIDIKKRIGDSILTIPDGYLIDFSFQADPRLYIIENELSSHDPYRHIGSQILKFAISYKESGRKIKAFLYDHLASAGKLALAEEQIKHTKYRNIDDFLESLIFEKPVAAIVVIDQTTPELENVLSQLTMSTDILEFQTFKCGEKCIYKFTPFNAEIREAVDEQGSSLKPEELNTVVVAAREDGFEKEVIGNSQWFAIRIHASMLDKLKYIAIYQVAPVSAITHYAEIASIDKWEDTNKYVLYFKDTAKAITPIPLDKDMGKKGLAPQAPRYTSIDKVLKAKKLSQVF
jgi:hypothetical protein